MANLRIIHKNLIDDATVTASSAASASLGVSNLKADLKSFVWRSVGTAARLDVLLASAGIVGGVVLPFTNLTSAATMRVRVSNEAAATNLIQYPRNLDQNFWGTFGGVLVTPNTVLAPDGTMTADVVTATGLTDCGIFQSQASAVNGTFTGSIWLKSPNPFPINVYITDPLGNNLISAVLTTSWQRFSVTRTVGATTGGTLQVGGAGTFKNGAVVHAWHGQLEAGTVATSAAPDLTSFVSRAGANGVKYEFNAAGALTQYAANTAVTAYDPVTLVSRGLSLEGSATNAIRNNTMVGAVSGTPGLPPTYWYVTYGAGIQSSILGTGNENGIDYIDIRWFGTATANFPLNVGFVDTSTAATTGQVWTASTFVKMVGGSQTGLSGNGLIIDEYTSADVYLTGGGSISGAIPSGGNLRMFRARHARTLSNAGTQRVTCYHTMLAVSGAAIDVTLRFGLPQLEQGAYPTSPIKASPTFVSRSGSNGIKYEFNSAGVLTQYAADVAVIAYDPVTLAVRGLSLEAAATNAIRNNTMVGAASGTPGTLPTNWAVSIPAGITRTVVGTGTENGINYIDIRFFGTASSAGQINISPETAGTAATSGQTWVHSAFVELSFGSLSNLAFKITQDQKTAGGTFVTGGPEASVTPTPAALRTQRVSTPPATISNGTVGLITPILYSNVASGATIDVTVRIGLPQLEQGVVATSPIKTAGTAGTRAADVYTSAAVTRAADVSTSPASTRPAGYIDSWQSYAYDSGVITACPGGARDLWGWQPWQLNVASYGFGGGSCARAWLSRTTAKAIAIDISDPSNPMGYIEASRLVVGDYWSPARNADYGAKQLPIDETARERSSAGDQRVTAGCVYDTVSLDMQWLNASDRAVFSRIMRRNGTRAPMFVSVYPDSSDPLREADNQVYGRFPSLGEITAYTLGYDSASLTIESI